MTKSIKLINRVIEGCHEHKCLVWAEKTLDLLLLLLYINAWLNYRNDIGYLCYWDYTQPALLSVDYLPCERHDSLNYILLTNLAPIFKAIYTLNTRAIYSELGDRSL